MTDFNPDGEYVLTAVRTRVTWKERQGDELITVGRRFKRGQVIEGVPSKQLRRLVDMGHAVPKDEYDPEDLAMAKARKRLMYDQNATSSAALERQLRAVRDANAQKTVGLEDAPEHEVDGIKVEDVDDLPNVNGDGEITTGDVADDDEDDYEDTVPSQTVPDIESLDYPSLVQEAKQAGLGGGGTKEEIKERLHDFYDGK